MRNDGYRGGGRGETVSYYFSLGNVSGFERKLEQAQEELSISPREYLPVTYETETRLGFGLGFGLGLGLGLGLRLGLG